MAGGWWCLDPTPAAGCFNYHLLRFLSLLVGQAGPYLYQEKAPASAPGML